MRTFQVNKFSPERETAEGRLFTKPSFPGPAPLLHRFTVLYRLLFTTSSHISHDTLVTEDNMSVSNWVWGPFRIEIRMSLKFNS